MCFPVAVNQAISRPCDALIVQRTKATQQQQSCSKQAPLCLHNARKSYYTDVHSCITETSTLSGNKEEIRNES